MNSEKAQNYRECVLHVHSLTKWLCLKRVGSCIPYFDSTTVFLYFDLYFYILPTQHTALHRKSVFYFFYSNLRVEKLQTAAAT